MELASSQAHVQILQGELQDAKDTIKEQTDVNKTIESQQEEIARLYSQLEDYHNCKLEVERLTEQAEAYQRAQE